MSRDAAWLPSEVADHLVELKTWVRWQWLLRGVGRVGLVTSLCLGAALFADYRLDMSPFGRGVAATSVATVTLLALIVWVLVPMCRRMGWNELAALAERAHPEWKGCLTSSVELNDPSHADNFAGSPVMRQMLHQQAGDRVAELDVERVVSSRAAWNSVKLGLIACFLLAVPIFVAPSTYRQLWQRLLVPWGNWGTAGAWQIDVANGDRVVARGSDVELLATAKYSKETETPKSLLLEWRDAAGTTDRRTMPFDDAREAFVAVVPHVMRDFDFRVLVDQQHSRNYRVQVVESPVVTNVRLDVEPPAYAGWPAQTIDGAVGSIRVFEHSRLRFTLEFNKPVEQAEFVWRSREQKTEFTLADNQQSATVEFNADPKITGPFAFAVKDRHDLTNHDTVPRELLVMTDEPPNLAVKGEHSKEVRPDDVLPIDVTTSDDIGVGELELYIELSGRKEQELQIAEQVRGQKQVEHRFTLDLTKLNLEQGQWLTYKVRVTDERPEPGPHEVWSEPRVLRVNRKAAPPGANELAKSHNELQNELKDLGRQIIEKRDALEKLRKEAELASRNQQEPPSRERFEELERQLRELTQRSEKLAQQLVLDPIFNELGEKVREVAQQELPAAEKETQLAKDDQGAEQSQDLRRAEQQLDNAAKKLQQLDKPFQQLADLQRDLLELRRLARQADQLANRADELAKNDAAKADASKPEAPANDGLNQPETPARDDQEQNAAEVAKVEQEKQQLAQDQQKLSDALNDLLMKRPELLNAARRDQLEQLAELSKQARELADQQQKLADAMKERQQEAAANTAELAQRQEDLQQRAERAAVEAETRDRTKNVSPVNPEPLRDAVAALQQGNLDEARRQQEKAANELDRLAAELEKAKAAVEAQTDKENPAEQSNAAKTDSDAKPPNDAKQNADATKDANKPNDANEPREANRPASLAEAARQLANEQAELAAKANEARAEQTPQQRQKVAEQLARDQDQLKDRIAELPVQTANKNEEKLELNTRTQPPNEADKPASDDPKTSKAAQSDQSPNDDAPKSDTPKDDVPKDDAPKRDVPKRDDSKGNAPKGDTPKGDAQKDDAPKDDTPKGDAPKSDAPKDDAPTGDAPKSDAPKGDDSKGNAPKGDAPKDDAPKNERQKDDGPKNDSQTSPNQAPNAQPGEEPEQPEQERKLSGSEAAQQRAVQHAEQAREALAQGNLDRAAQEQRRTEQALHDVAARAEAAEQMQQANTPQGQADQKNSGEKRDPAENNNAPDANALNRELPQSEQVAQLAEEQRQLMQEVARALEQQQSASANPQQQQADNKQQPAQNDSPMPRNNDANTQEQLPANQAAQQLQANAPQEGQNKSQNQETPTAQKVRDTQAAQQELAQQAQQLAERVKQELGNDSKEAQEATQAARLCGS